ncbi:MAG: hypothetical protein KC421_17440 [Anaerolineales bacterium]|nr:hypothetical protein [Anaerolineales bacterium]
MGNILATITSIIAGIILGVGSNWLYDILKKKKLLPEKPTLQRTIVVILFLSPFVILVALPSLINNETNNPNQTINIDENADNNRIIQSGGDVTINQLYPTPTIENSVITYTILIPPYIKYQSLLTQEQITEKCKWLDNNFPQSKDLVTFVYKVPEDFIVSLEYLDCPDGSTVASGMYVMSRTVGDESVFFSLIVPENGCIDVFDRDSTFVQGEFVKITEDILRVYNGTVSASVMAYWPICIF